MDEHRPTKRGFFGKSELAGLVIMIVVVLGLVADADKTDEGDNFYNDVIRLDNVATKIHQSYVEDIGSEALVDKAIEGMIGILDPHTTYFKQKEYDELRIQTEGKFGGLGIQISIRDKVLTVMTPISGTPAARAGIQSGDQIIKINGKSTEGIKIDAAVNKLRGEPGTEVAITIRRKGENRDLDYSITREVITIKSVPFAGVIGNNIGYVRLLSFSQEAGGEVEKAVKTLVDKGVKGMIFDLRSNPGGLLPEAVEVSEKFLERKSLVVSTRGRLRGQNKEFYASASPVLPPNLPLVVLVNSASASASEIVSGAIQDWDRGVILGDTTFGKGSVQSILPLDKDHHLKLTTAYYYTPSGRCINKPENAMRGLRKAGGEDEDGDDSAAADTAVRSTADSIRRDTTSYFTKAGRRVHGGGGIIPDTIVEAEIPPAPVQKLLVKDAFFKFANALYPKLKKRKAVLDTSFVVDDKLMEQFRAYLDSISFDYSSFVKSDFDEFKKRAGLIDSVKDSLAARYHTRPEWTAEEKKQMAALSSQIESLLAGEGKREFSGDEKEIRQLVREALLVRERGQDDEMIFRMRLSEDPQVKSALGLIADKKAYARLLATGQKHK